MVKLPNCATKTKWSGTLELPRGTEEGPTATEAVGEEAKLHPEWGVATTG